MLDGLARPRLAGAVLVLSGLAVAAAVLIPGSGGDSADGARGGAPKGPAAGVSVPPLGLAFAYPSTWTRRIYGRAIRLRSPEGSVLLTVSSPVTGQHPASVKAALKAELRRRLTPATVLRDGPAALGPRRASSFELSGRSRGARVRALGIVASTPFRTYAVTLITSTAPSRRRLREAQAVLASVRLAKPR